MAFVLALSAAFTAGVVASPRFASADSTTIPGAADANITGNTVNLDPPYSYGLVTNVYENTHTIVDVPLASIPRNATINSVQVNFQEVGYTSASGVVSISGYDRHGSITASDGNGAAPVGAFRPADLGLGVHSVDLNSTGVSLVSSLLGTSSHLGLRLADSTGNVNASFASVEQSAFWTPPSITVSFAMPTTPELVPMIEANVTGNTVNQLDPSAYGMVVSTFSSTKSVLDYSLAALPVNASVAAATLNFYETSYANSSGLVSIYAYSRSGAITSTDANIAGTLIGSYSSVNLGTGNHSIALNAAGLDIIQYLLGTNHDLGLKLVAASGDTNTQFASLESPSGFSAPVLSLTLAPNLPGDSNRDQIVNAQDIALISSNWLAKGIGKAGDINRDGIVNTQDIAIVSSNWLQSIGGGTAAATAVPEPGSIMLAAIGFAGFLVAGFRSSGFHRCR